MWLISHPIGNEGQQNIVEFEDASGVFDWMQEQVAKHGNLPGGLKVYRQVFTAEVAAGGGGE